MRAAEQTSEREITKDNLVQMERYYKRNPDNQSAAMRYARALREINELPKALIVLEPFIGQNDTSPVLELEYVSVQLESGAYEAAERIAKEVSQEHPEHGMAYHLMGIAQDAQGAHASAEKSFRKALDHWRGDPVPVMNNLALSLTAQGFLDEAAEILHKAKDADPNRREIERNLRIVNALRETETISSGRTSSAPPTPSQKPNM
jgi:Flp pilus assembly protein TadD